MYRVYDNSCDSLQRLICIYKNMNFYKETRLSDFENDQVSNKD